MTDPDYLALANQLDWHAVPFEDTAKQLGGLGQGHADAAADLRAAAVALRHHANLIDAIGDPDELSAIAAYLAHKGNPLCAAHVDRIAAAVSPPPAPTTCPTCGSDDPHRQHAVESWISDTIRCDEPCPDPWHQAAT